jgi:hypothetical protein
VFYWSNLNIKDTLARLRRNQDPDNGPVWEVPDDIDDEYLAQMESEHRIRKNGKWMWSGSAAAPTTTTITRECRWPPPPCSRSWGGSQHPGAG